MMICHYSIQLLYSLISSIPPEKPIPCFGGAVNIPWKDHGHHGANKRSEDGVPTEDLGPVPSRGIPPTYIPPIRSLPGVPSSDIGCKTWLIEYPLLKTWYGCIAYSNSATNLPRKASIDGVKKYSPPRWSIHGR
jgi:hypothetical protein